MRRALYLWFWTQSPAAWLLQWAMRASNPARLEFLIVAGIVAREDLKDVSGVEAMSPPSKSRAI